MFMTLNLCKNKENSLYGQIIESSNDVATETRCSKIERIIVGIALWLPNALHNAIF
jgi:hypothetical protein